MRSVIAKLCGKAVDVEQDQVELLDGSFAGSLDGAPQFDYAGFVPWSDDLHEMAELAATENTYPIYGHVLTTTAGSKNLLANHLPVKCGDTVQILSTQQGWSECSTSDGRTGWVRSAFLRMIIPHDRGTTKQLVMPPEHFEQPTVQPSGLRAGLRRSRTVRDKLKAEDLEEEIVLEQLANLQDCPFLDFTAAETMLLHFATGMELSESEGCYLLWRPDTSSSECRSLGVGDACLRRGFTALILSFIDAMARAYRGSWSPCHAVSARKWNAYLMRLYLPPPPLAKKLQAPYWHYTRITLPLHAGAT
jgi:hypothetical protein